MTAEPTLILRTDQNSDLPDRIELDDHKPMWETAVCPSCGSAPCVPHPDWLTCKYCEDDWPCAAVRTTADELDRQASAFEERAEQLKRSNPELYSVFGAHREDASALRARAAELRGQR